MKRLLLAFLVSAAFVNSARADLAVTPGTGATILTKQDGSGKLAPSHTVCDATAPGTCAPVSATIGVGVNELDGSNVTIGAKADAKSTATDTTPITIMSVLKQISASIQAAASSLAGTLTVATHAVTQSGTWNVTNVSGTVSLPTGASTAANQATEIASLATIATNSASALPAQSVTTVNIGNVGGLAASGASTVGNPMLDGGRAQNAEATAVTNGQAVASAHDLVGKQIVLPYANPENFVSGAITSAMTGTTSTSLIAAPASGLRNYITNCVVSNAHATVGTDIVIQDGSGGTTLYTLPAAPAYGGASVTFPAPLRQPTTATAIFVANVTTGASTKASCSGYKGA